MFFKYVESNADCNLGCEVSDGRREHLWNHVYFPSHSWSLEVPMQPRIRIAAFQRTLNFIIRKGDTRRKPKPSLIADNYLAKSSHISEQLIVVAQTADILTEPLGRINHVEG
jgi:hypothetical protein